MMIPKNEPLYASCYGCIRYCPHQCLFRLYFGEMQLALGTETLRQFSRKITQLSTDIERLCVSSLATPMWICPPGMDGKSFTFYPDEVLDLYDLLSGALTMIEMSEFLTENGFLIKS